MPGSSQAKSVKKVEKEVKSMKEAFAQLQQTEEEDSDVSEESESVGESHFQFQFIQDLQLEPKIEWLFKQSLIPRLKRICERSCC
jgi:hypothetical protein